ncbi:MAG: hypothetical protein R3A10_00505 [Caldilineaceae bacterium]
MGSPGVRRRAGPRDIVGSPRHRPGVNPPGYATTPRQRGWAVGGDEPGSAGVAGSPGRSRRGGSARHRPPAAAPKMGPSPGVNRHKGGDSSKQESPF